MIVNEQWPGSLSVDVGDVREMLKKAARATPHDGMIELVGVSFLADEESIYGSVNEDYVRRELEWYDSMSYSVNDFPGGAPKIWRDVSSKVGGGGYVNSNYGRLVLSDDSPTAVLGPVNGTDAAYEYTSQYWNVLRELRRDPTSRRALAIYTWPQMHLDQHTEGMQDFVCTNAVQYLLRDGGLHAIVQMRSNDAVFGYRNDRAWQLEVLRRLAVELDVGRGTITWQVGSLHVYPRHRHLVETWAETGEWDVPVAKKKEEK